MNAHDHEADCGCGHDPRCTAPSPEVLLHSVKEGIRTHGWYAIGVFGTKDSTSFVYTIGFSESFEDTEPQPEFVIAGLDPYQANELLHTIADLLRGGRDLTREGNYENIISGYPARLRLLDLPSCEVPFSVSNMYYGYSVPRFQLLWPDQQGHFPGDPQCDPHVAAVQHIGGLQPA